jgi:hypothetical protein
MTESATGPAVAATDRHQQKIFVSYARQDRDKIRNVVEGLRLLGNDVWFDEELSGGQAWWDTILQRIRSADVFVQTITPSSARSQACESERHYATAVGKPVLPVFLEELPTSILPSDLAVLQAVDYLDESPERRAFRLAGALQRLPATPPLPEQLPAPPPVPLSYLVELSDQLRTPSLTLDEQMQIVSRLRKAVAEPEDHAAALELLRQLKARSDLYYAVVADVDRLRTEIEEARAGPAPAPAPAPAPPPQAEPEPAASAPPSPPPETPAPVEAAPPPAPVPPATDAALEAELAKWNWGAFLLAWIWGVGNNVYRAFLTWVPFYGLYEWYLLGRNGNRWAWEKGNWSSVEAFRATQRKWAMWGVIVVAFVVVVVIASSGSGSG